MPDPSTTESSSPESPIAAMAQEARDVAECTGYQGVLPAPVGSPDHYVMQTVPHAHHWHAPGCGALAERDAALAEVTRLREALAAARVVLVEWRDIESCKGIAQNPEDRATLAAIDAALAEGSDVLPTGGAE